MLEPNPTVADEQSREQTATAEPPPPEPEGLSEWYRKMWPTAVNDRSEIESGVALVDEGQAWRWFCQVQVPAVKSDPELGYRLGAELARVVREFLEGEPRREL